MMAKTDKHIDATFGDWLGEETREMPRFQLVHGLDALYGSGPEEEEIQRAEMLLRAKLEQAMPPVVYYDMFEDRKLGLIWLATRGRELVAISYAKSEDDFLRYLGKLLEGRFVRSETEVAWAEEDVVAYLHGERTEINVHADLTSATEFQRRVLEETSKIPRGQIATYAEIAKRIGKPKASRAVGQALRRNPIPIVVPCHRVVASDGTLGGYSGRMGDERKVHLLKLEGVVFA